MEVARKVAGIYMVALAAVVGIFFIINIFLLDSLDVPGIWAVLDYLMAIALIPALIFNYMRKREERGGEGITRSYLEANVLFYLTAAVVLIFFHNWFYQLAEGIQSPDLDNHSRWIIWAYVDTMLPLVVGATGCRLWCGNGK